MKDQLINGFIRNLVEKTKHKCSGTGYGNPVSPVLRGEGTTWITFAQGLPESKLSEMALPKVT